MKEGILIGQSQKDAFTYSETIHKVFKHIWWRDQQADRAWPVFTSPDPDRGGKHLKWVVRLLLLLTVWGKTVYIDAWIICDLTVTFQVGGKCHLKCLCQVVRRQKPVVQKMSLLAKCHSIAFLNMLLFFPLVYPLCLITSLDSGWIPVHPSSPAPPVYISSINTSYFSSPLPLRWTLPSSCGRVSRSVS